LENADLMQIPQLGDLVIFPIMALNFEISARKEDVGCKVRSQEGLDLLVRRTMYKFRRGNFRLISSLESDAKRTSKPESHDSCTVISYGYWLSDSIQLSHIPD
jgi:hypothetical protein